MKLSDNYLLKDINGHKVALPFGQNIIDKCPIIELQNVSFFICKNIVNETALDSLLELIYKEYNIDVSEKDSVKADVCSFINSAISKGLIV